jgi:hypothetical protein
VWVNTATGSPFSGVQNILGITDSAHDDFAVLCVDNLGIPEYVNATAAALDGPTSIFDGAWHHIAVVTTGTGAGSVSMYIDGVVVGSTITGTTAARPQRITVGEQAGTYTNGRWYGNIGQVEIYTSALSAARIAEHAAATNGYSGDTTDARIARYLGMAGLTSSDWTLDAGQTTVGTYPQAGKSVVQACQDMATTEGGGAAFWVRPADGDVRFVNRRYRDSTTPVLTLDALVDLDALVYDPTFDETTLVNESTVSRSAESGTLSTQTYTDTVSAAAYGPASGDVTTYTLSDLDALNLAQSQVAGNAQPGFRLDQLAVNLHASTSSKYAALAALEIGSRIRIVNLPRGAAPLGTVDLILEGWTEYPSPTSYRWVADTSPADNPPIGKWDTFRWQADGQTLNTALTNSGTTVVIATTAGLPTFTTGAFYPLDITIGAEQIRLNTAPGGSTSPQTFTGVTRGVNGTFAAAQAAGSVITLAPATAWAL